MAGYLLTTQSSVLCPHGGTVQVGLTTDAQAQVNGGFALLETDVHFVTGCPFAPGPTPSPCLLVRWSGGSTAVRVNGAGVLTQSSTGLCIGPAGIQGQAIVVNTQTEARTSS